MRSNPTLVAVALVGVVLAATGAAVLVSSPPKVPLSADPDAADAVTLYQNGIVFVELDRRYSAVGGPMTITFSVPTSTIFESIRLLNDDVVVKDIRSSRTVDPLIHPGDQVTMHLRDGRTFTGIVVAADGDGFVIADTDGTTIIRHDAIEAIELPGRLVDAGAPGAMNIDIVVEAPQGHHDVTLTYLASGPGWTPDHHFETESGRLTTFATLSSLSEWKNVTLTLVAGAPNIVARPPPMAFDSRSATVGLAAGDAGEASYAESFASSVPLGELHTYRLAEPIDLHRGESVRLMLLDETATIERHYLEVSQQVWQGGRGSRTDVPVIENYEIINPHDDPLPPGIVRSYREGVWIGEDMLQATPARGHSNITTGTSRTVDATLVLEDVEGNGQVYTWALTVSNKKTDGATVDLRALISHPSYQAVLRGSSPPPDQVQGTTLTWNDDLEPGQSITYRLTFEQIPQR